MKRFIVSILCVTVFCVGLGALVEKAGATFKSDEKALGLIRQARLALGGEQSIADVRSMIIKGNTTLTFKADGASRTEQGETEIAIQLPDKLSRMVRIGRGDGSGDEIVNRKHDVMILRGEGHGEGVGVGEGGEKRVVVRKIDGPGNVEVEKIIADGKDGEFATADGNKVIIRKAEKGDAKEFRVEGGEKVRRVAVESAGAHEGRRHNELLRVTLSLLATPPVGMDVSYSFAGEKDVDGTSCNVVNAEFGGSSITLYLSKVSSLPVMVSYQGHAMPSVMRFHSKVPAPGDSKEIVVLDHKVEAPALAEVQVRYSDYRSVNGVQLPYKWTTSIAGQTTEVFDVTNYEINPANIAEKFKNERTFVRTKKEAN